MITLPFLILPVRLVVCRDRNRSAGGVHTNLWGRMMVGLEEGNIDKFTFLVCIRSTSDGPNNWGYYYFCWSDPYRRTRNYIYLSQYRMMTLPVVGYVPHLLILLLQLLTPCIHPPLAPNQNHKYTDLRSRSTNAPRSTDVCT